MRYLVTLIKKLNDWFFEPVDPTVLSVYRVGLGIICLANAVIIFLPHIYSFFSAGGIVPASIIAAQTTNQFSILFLYDAPWFVTCLEIGLIIASVLMILGKYPRLSVLYTYIVLLSFLNRFPIAYYGGQQVLLILLFFSLFIDFNLQKKKDQLDLTAPAVRILQLQIFSVYFFAGINKIHLDSWFYGYYMQLLIFDSLTIHNLYWLSFHPFLLILANYYTLFVEAVCSVLLWNPSTRRFVLINIVLLHVGIILLLNVQLFSEIMIVSLILFTKKDDYLLIQRGWQKLTSWRPLRRSIAV